MTTIQFKCFIMILSMILALNLTNARYIKTQKESELSKKMAPTNSLDDDIDLETFIDDYYDNLWEYLESLFGDLEKNKKNKKEGEKEKPDFMDYDYMSDMPASEPEFDGKKFKNLDGDLKGDEKGNFTGPNASEAGVNDSNGDGGIPDIIKANRESNSQEEYPLRSKQMRLKSIIDQVLSFRGGSSKLNGTIPDVKQYNALQDIYEKNIRKIKDEWTSSYTEKDQSFYPSCELPRNTDENVWTDPNSMNLLFDLNYPSPAENFTIMIVTAKLRLYKLPQENYSLPSPDTKWEKSQNYYGIHSVDEDRQIRVSVYWYTKSLRHQRVKKKLLDSQMMSLYAAKWTEFNVRPAVRTWKESGKNFGLVVNVEDEDGSLLPAKQYIQTMNCSKWTATVRPIPSIIMDRLNQYYIENPTEGKNESFDETKNGDDKHKIYPYQPFLYPIIDLRTREIPSSDTENVLLMNSARFFNFQRKGFNVSDDSIGNFLKKNNLNIDDIMRLSRIDKSNLKKSDTRNSEIRNSYFQNVPIGSPNRGYSEEINHSKKDNEGENERVMPRIRHNRRQKEVYQKSIDSRSHSDFNATEHH